MKHESYYTCDIGNERFEDRNSVRNDVSVINGENGRNYGDVCDKHIIEFVQMIDERFPKNKHKKNE